MSKTKVLGALGGDCRQGFIMKLFEKQGFTTICYGVEKMVNTANTLSETVEKADYLLLPVPITKDGYRLNCSEDIMLMDLVKSIRHDAVVFAGKMPPYLKDYLRSTGITYYDYYEDKEYIWRNAEISAEGAVSMLMNETEVELCEIKALICGYGRIGKCLAGKLKELGVNVTVAARKEEDLLLARYCGEFVTDRIDYRRKGIFDIERTYDVVFNTVPSWIFDRSNSKLIENAIYFELASAPYGGEAGFLKGKCGKYILASGIPGKYAPKSAADAAFKAIFNYLDREVEL